MSLLTSRRRRCPVCGADHATCGGPTTTTPVDVYDTKGNRVSDQSTLARYEVTVNGRKTVMKLTASEARKRGDDARQLSDGPRAAATDDARAVRTRTKAAPRKASA